jgi:hypothetical protein
MATSEHLSGPAPKGSKLMTLSTRVEGDTFFCV